mmetsp:Transcript_16086/g.37174  ORF Transcript_16086/g.37174 Transcript_16086/m.37174 type:complete len:278 (-) Transcript_16086:1525-2358(-)
MKRVALTPPLTPDSQTSLGDLLRRRAQVARVEVHAVPLVMLVVLAHLNAHVVHVLVLLHVHRPPVLPAQTRQRPAAGVDDSPAVVVAPPRLVEHNVVLAVPALVVVDAAVALVLAHAPPAGRPHCLDAREEDYPLLVPAHEEVVHRPERHVTVRRRRGQRVVCRARSRPLPVVRDARGVGRLLVAHDSVGPGAQQRVVGTVARPAVRVGRHAHRQELEGVVPPSPPGRVRVAARVLQAAVEHVVERGPEPREEVHPGVGRGGVLAEVRVHGPHRLGY